MTIWDLLSFKDEILQFLNDAINNQTTNYNQTDCTAKKWDFRATRLQGKKWSEKIHTPTSKKQCFFRSPHSNCLQQQIKFGGEPLRCGCCCCSSGCCSACCSTLLLGIGPPCIGSAIFGGGNGTSSANVTTGFRLWSFSFPKPSKHIRWLSSDPNDIMQGSFDGWKHIPWISDTPIRLTASMISWAVVRCNRKQQGKLIIKATTAKRNTFDFHSNKNWIDH